MMINVENLWSINERYGIKNGDRALKSTVLKLDHFFREKGIDKLPIGRYKGGDFLLLLAGEKEKYRILLELFLSKYQNYVDNEIEIRLEAVMIDSRLSNDIELLTSRLYELHNNRIESEKRNIIRLMSLSRRYSKR